MSSTSSTLRSAPSAASRVYDENEQIQIVKKFKAQAASFDTMTQRVFLIVSIAVVGVAIFVAGRLDEGHVLGGLNSNNNHQEGSSGGGAATSSAVIRHWLVNGVALFTISYGCLQTLRFRPELHFREWLFQTTTVQAYACAVINLVTLVIQLGSSSSIVGPAHRNSNNDSDFDAHLLWERIFYHCSGPVLGLVHGLAWPTLKTWMSSTQNELLLLETKKYQISNA